MDDVISRTVAQEGVVEEEREQIARWLMRRFHGWTVWYGDATGTWQGLKHHHGQVWLYAEALRPEELTRQIGRAVPVVSPPIGPQLMWPLDAVPKSAGEARRTVGKALRGWDALEWHDDALLIASDLVTYALSRGKPPLALSMTLADNWSALAVEVSDGSTGLPSPDDPADLGGFGLSVVACLAQITIRLDADQRTIEATLPRSTGATEQA